MAEAAGAHPVAGPPALPSAAGAPAAHLVHASPGRVRLRVPAARNQPEHLEQARRRLASQRGVRAVHVDHRTGSILVLGDIAMEALEALGRSEGLFDFVPPRALKPLTDEVAHGLEAADGWLRGISRGRLGVAGVLALGLAAVAAVQMVRGKVGAPAITLLWYAFSLMLIARPGQRPALS